MYPPIMILFDV